MKAKEKKTCTVAVRLHEKDHKDLKMISAKSGVKMQDIFLNLIKGFLDVEEVK